MLKIFTIGLSIAALLITSSPVHAKKIRLRTVNDRYSGTYVIYVETGSSKSKKRYFQIIYEYPAGRNNPGRTYVGINNPGRTYFGRTYRGNRERRRKLTHVANCGSYTMSNAVKTESFDSKNRIISLDTSNYVNYSTPQLQSFEEKALQLTCK